MGYLNEESEIKKAPVNILSPHHQIFQKSTIMEQVYMADGAKKLYTGIFQNLKMKRQF